MLMDRWNKCHEQKYQITKTPSGAYEPVEGRKKNSKTKTQKFCNELNNPKKYFLRGDNKVRALKDGRPINYDRAAMLCVSVFHLSHWRNDVTASHYML